MDPLRIYDYLMMTRQRVLDAARGLTPEQYRREFPIGIKTIARTLTHIMISEWYYIERLAGRAVPPYAQWPIKDEDPPAFEVLDRTWREQARHVRTAIAAEKDWKRTITWLGFPDDSRGGKRFQITCTAGDMLTQMAFHEVHHRAQAMAMFRQLGQTIVEDLDFNNLMYERREMK